MDTERAWHSRLRGMLFRRKSTTNKEPGQLDHRYHLRTSYGGAAGYDSAHQLEDLYCNCFAIGLVQIRNRLPFAARADGGRRTE